jgi:PAS domain S-box-containing protein
MARQFKILMVEDEPAHVELVSRAFEKHTERFELAVASSLEGAKQYLSADCPDLVLVDLFLPDGKGSDLLLGNAEGALFPVVVMTSHGDEKAAVEAMKAGALDYIAKSEVTLRDMPHLVTQALREWRHKIKRRKAEESLAEEKERLAVTLRSIGDAVITTDIEGRISLINRVAEHLTGWRLEEALGEPLERVFNIINEHTRERCDNPVALVLETGQIIGLANNTVLISRDGTERVIEDSGAPILDQQKRTIGVVLVFRDATEKRRSQDERQKAQRLESIGILAGGIAHDFNNSLMAIIGNISLAKFYAKPGDKVFEKLEEIERAAMRTKDLTQQLLTFSKGGEPIKEIVSIAELLKEAVLFTLRGSNVRCTLDLPENLWPVSIDAGQMNQVFSNIIINAEQSMPEGGIIEVDTQNVDITSPTLVPSGPGKYVKISIRDQGIGIRRDHLTKIFDPYFTTKQKGSGIGLTVAHSIVDRHNGYITAESEGNGSILHVYLPAVEGALSELSSRPGELVSGSGKVLLMDDEQIIRAVGSEMLQLLGYEVVCARDGAEAVDLYRQVHEQGLAFDAVILDLTIPGGMGGKEAVSKILSLDPTAAVIVSSGYSNDQVISKYRHYGFRGAVCKPYRLQELSAVLHEVLVEKRNG